MTKIIATLLIVLALVAGGFLVYQRLNTSDISPTTDNSQTYRQSTQAATPQADIDNEMKQIDAGLNSTSETDFDVSNLSDTNL